MQVATIEIDREEARKRVEEFTAKRRKKLTEMDQALYRGYKALSEGLTLIDVNQAIKAGGHFEDNYCPKMAIARSDATTVYFEHSFSYSEGQAEHGGRFSGFQPGLDTDRQSEAYKEAALAAGAYAEQKRQALVHADSRFIDWVVAGGESGPCARPMHPDWARSLRDQCVSAGVPFFFKQWGQWAPTANVGFGDSPRAKTHVFRTGTVETYGGPVPVGIEMRCIGKKDAGRLLDGREWNEYPKENHATIT